MGSTYFFHLQKPIRVYIIVAPMFCIIYPASLWSFILDTHAGSTSYRRAEGETTEWEDILKAKGIVEISQVSFIFVCSAV